MKWKIFKDFLIHQNAFNAFLESYDNNRVKRPRLPLMEYLEYLDKRTEGDLGKWIDSSMTWIKTKQGHEYWSRIHSKFITYCKECQLRDKKVFIGTYLKKGYLTN